MKTHHSHKTKKYCNIKQNWSYSLKTKRVSKNENKKSFDFSFHSKKKNKKQWHFNCNGSPNSTELWHLLIERWAKVNIFSTNKAEI